MPDTLYGRDRRGAALALLCCVQLLVFLDATVVNVALPTIERELEFSQHSLAWVVNAYALTFGSFLVLAGRAGDVLGRKRILMAGLWTFVLASGACAVAGSRSWLIGARGLQGVGAAIVSPVALSMIAGLYEEPAQRARAMGAFSFVAATGASAGVVVGGALTAVLGWHSVFAVNLPLGAMLVLLAPRLLQENPRNRAAEGGLDVAGALLISAAVMLATLGLSAVADRGCRTAPVLGLLGAAVALAGLFGWRQRQASAPLIPPGLLRTRAVSAANVLAMLVRAAMVGWFFFSALYMQRVLGFSALEVGLGFLPATLILGALSRSAAASAVTHAGVRAVFCAGAAATAGGLVLLALAGAHGSYPADVLPGMLLLGAGGGLLFLPLVLTATTSGPREHAGVAAGVLNTAQQLGGALGLAALSTASGFRLAFTWSAGLAAAAGLLGLLLLPQRGGAEPAWPQGERTAAKSDPA